MMTFAGFPVMDLRPNYDGPSLATGRDLVFSTRGFGIVTPWAIQPNAQRTLSLPFLLEGKSDIATFIHFFDQLPGRAGLFWIPAYQNAMALNSDVASNATTLLCGDTGLAGRLGEHPGYAYGCLVSPGLLAPFRIISVTAAAGAMTVTTASPIGTAFTASETMVSWLLLARLSADQIALTYVTDALVQAQLDAIEIPREYPT